MVVVVRALATVDRGPRYEDGEFPSKTLVRWAERSAGSKGVEYRGGRSLGGNEAVVVSLKGWRTASDVWLGLAVVRSSRGSYT